MGMPATSSCVRPNDLPLPCSRVLWEADTETGWEMEYRKHLATRKGKTMSIGDLGALNNMEVFGRVAFDFEDLFTWSTESDGFGALFLLVANHD